MKSNDANFILRLQRKKEDALEYIVDHYLPLIKGITHNVLSPLGNDGIIEECINDIFLSIWDHSHTFTGDSTDFRKWICVIAKFKSVDYYRKNNKTASVSLEERAMGTGESAEDELIRMEDKTELIKLINQLEPMDRDIFMMKFFLGFKTGDIAAKLGLTKASIDN